MATAPHAAAVFQIPSQRLVAAPLTIGTPLAPDELPGWRFVVEFAFGAALTNPSSSWGPWTDVTGDVLQADNRMITISPLGRQDENSQTPAAGCTFTLDNRLNLYSKNNPLSPNWPNVRDNTPVRVRISPDNGLTWYVFFWGEATVMQPAWDVTGGFAIVNVTAKGRLQRLNQHSATLRSALERAISGSGPVAYWPLEDKAGATQVASGLSGGASMLVVGPVGFGQAAGPTGSDSLANFPQGSQTFLTGNVPAGSTSTQWRVEFIVNFGVLPASSSTSVLWIASEGTIGGWYIRDSNVIQGLFVTTYTPTGAPISSYNSGIDAANDTWRHVRLDASQSGGNIAFTLSLDGTPVVSSTYAGTLGRVTRIQIFPDLLAGWQNSVSVGHIAVWAPWASTVDTIAAITGHPGETALARMTRLSSEEGIEFQQVGYYSSIVTMGPQGIDSYINLMRECETVEDGFLYDGYGAGLTYQPPSQRYDQATAITLDVLANEIQQFEPLDDDLLKVNKATVSQKSGSTYVAEQTTGILGTGPDGMGVIESPLTMNVDRGQLAFYRAAWETWKGAGSNSGFRYPVIPLNLRARPSVAAKWIARADGWPGPVVPGCKMTITNISNWATQFQPGALDLMIEGIQAVRLSKYTFEMDLVCTPNRRYDVFKVADAQLGRIQTAGSSLAADTAIGGTTLTVATQSGSVIWTTVGPFPLYAEVDGIQVKVTNITGSTSPQTFTVDGATVVKPLLTGKPVRAWRPGVIKY